jgi:protein-disulfide isomerase
LIALAVLAVIAAGAAGYFLLFPGDSGTVIADTPKLAVEVTARDRTVGSSKANILVLEYAAPSCPHCAHFDIDILPQFKKDWVDTGKAYYVFRVLPIAAVDVAAESIARCLPADRYFPFIDLLYRNQPKWDPEYGVTDVHGALVQMGQLEGLSSSKVDACINDRSVAKKTEQVAQEGVTKYNLQGTPSFIVNGVLHGPFGDYKEMQTFLIAVANTK